MNLYAFLSQIIPYSDSDLELLSSFGRALLPHLRVEKEGAIQLGDDVGLEYYRLQRISVGAAVGTRTIALVRPRRRAEGKGRRREA